MENMLKKGQAVLLGMFSGDDPLRLFSLMLAMYLGISAATPSASATLCCQPAHAQQHSPSLLPAGGEAALSLDDEAVIGRAALPVEQQQAAPRWVF